MRISRAIKEYVYATFVPDEETRAVFAPRHAELRSDIRIASPRSHQRIVHGLPITPEALLDQLAGGSFCVSYQAPEQLDHCMRLLSPESILILDNGAYSHWRRGRGQINRDRYWDWANCALGSSELAVAVIPDVIGGSEAENWQEASYAVREGWCEYPERSMFIWHMNESLTRLRDAARLFNFIGFGSCAEYDVQRHRRAYLNRLRQAREVLKAVGQRWHRWPHVHLMRGLAVLHRVPWAASADSTNIARNHHRTADRELHVAEMHASIAQKLYAAYARAPLQMSLPM